MSPSNLQIIGDVYLQAVQFPDCVVQRFLSVAEGSAASPGGGGACWDGGAQGGGGRVPRSHSATPVRAEVGKMKYLVHTQFVVWCACIFSFQVMLCMKRPLGKTHSHTHTHTPLS